MAQRTDISSESARESVLVANTPDFLFRRLLADPAAHQLAAGSTAEDIIARFLENARRMREDAQALVMTYICLAALALKDRSDVMPRLKQLATDFEAVPWGTRMYALIEHHMRPTTCVMVSLQPKVREEIAAVSPITTSRTTLNITPRLLNIED